MTIVLNTGVICEVCEVFPIIGLGLECTGIII